MFYLQLTIFGLHGKLHAKGHSGILAAALTSVMRRGRKSRARLKFDNLVRIANGDVNEARRHILATIVETFLPLSARRDQTEFADIISKEAAAKGVEAMISPYEERGIQIGRQQGLQQGHQQGHQQGALDGQREMLLYALRSRVGSISETIVVRVNAMTDTAEMKALMDRVLNARTLDEAGI